MKKSVIAICGAALAAVAFAQEPSCDCSACHQPPCQKGEVRCEGPKSGCPGARPVELFVTDKTDDAAIEAYKGAVLAQIDEAVAKYRAHKPADAGCKCESCACEGGCKCGEKSAARPPLRLSLSVGFKPMLLGRGDRPGRGREGLRPMCRGPKGAHGRGPRCGFKAPAGAPAPEAPAPAPEVPAPQPPPAPEAE
ncbi:MAG: hypothetical protein J6U17_02695 [Kiritimatiellae bacterium]|nr:hypothetical protein [Kiritimatiellia bacterium]